MKFTLSWLKDHLETTASFDEIVETLTRIGLEVERRRGQGEDAGALHGRLRVSAEQHPNADRLRVCMVDTGDGATDPGRLRRAERPHRHEERVRAARHLHSGQEHHAAESAPSAASRATACCARRRSSKSRDDHDGIIDLPDDAPVGVPYAAYAGLDDPVIEINLTPNRPDCTVDPRHRPRSRRGRPRHAQGRCRVRAVAAARALARSR